MYPDNFLTRPELTANINSRKQGFVSKMQTLIPTHINKFTVHAYHAYKQTLNYKIYCDRIIKLQTGMSESCYNQVTTLPYKHSYY